MIQCLWVLVLVASLSWASPDFPQLNHVNSKVSPEGQTQAVNDLLVRLIKDRASDILIKVDASIGPKDKDIFQISNGHPGQILVTGTSGVAASMGVYYYLKTYCHIQRTWAGQQTELPLTLPAVAFTITITTNDRFRYYQNVCTESYSMAFWQWPRWEQEIDWMALQGINLPLAFTGQEAIFQRVFLRLGFNQTDLDAHFGGPAFLAWARMGNIEGWGGPLPQMWITNKLVLQHQILKRMRSLGMTPVLPGFAGHMPRAVVRVFPHAKVTRSSKWGHFNTTYTRVYLLDFNDPLFKKIGKMFIKLLTDEFGTNHVYNADTFNEMSPASSDPAYLSSVGKAMFSAMTAADPQAVWLMQGWMFLSSFWKAKQVEALVRSVPLGRMIILDLASDIHPIYLKTKSYYGQPWIWCMLHNFGGTIELYGAVDSVNAGPFKGRMYPNSTMIGTGITPEGIHQNEVMYEFMSENAWRKSPVDVSQWASNYARQRYGIDSPEMSAAWKLLMRTVYNCTDRHHDNDRVILTLRPRLDRTPTIWYQPEDLFTAWDYFLNASQKLERSQLFHYDMADITRNCLQVISNFYFKNMTSAYYLNHTDDVKSAGKNISDLIADMDYLLNSNERFLFGRWQAEARSWSTDPMETRLLEYNARNQITLWGPNGEIVDYASKQWAAVLKDYFKPRWEFYTNWLVKLIQTKAKWDYIKYTEKIMKDVETPWTLGMYEYPTKITGNTNMIARDLHAKYRPETNHKFFSEWWEMEQRRREKSKYSQNTADGLSFQRVDSSDWNKH